MISNLNKQRFEYIWHLYYEDKTDKDLSFANHKPCDPEIWQFPKPLEVYHDIIFEKMPEAFKDKTVLDVGCGTAWYLGCMENTVKQYRGFDPDEKSIRYAKIMSDIVDVDSFIATDSVETHDCRADTILILSVTHYIDDVEKALHKFDSRYLIMDSWETFGGKHLDDHIALLTKKGYKLKHKTEWGNPPKKSNKRFILHFDRHATESAVI